MSLLQFLYAFLWLMYVEVVMVLLWLVFLLPVWVVGLVVWKVIRWLYDKRTRNRNNANGKDLRTKR